MYLYSLRYLLSKRSAYLESHWEAANGNGVRQPEVHVDANWCAQGLFGKVDIEPEILATIGRVWDGIFPSLDVERLGPAEQSAEGVLRWFQPAADPTGNGVDFQVFRHRHQVEEEQTGAEAVGEEIQLVTAWPPCDGGKWAR